MLHKLFGVGILKALSIKSMFNARFCARWIANREGTTAIEFSLLAIPYLMIALAIIELSIMYASASMVEGATGSAARMIRTGQIQQATTDPEELFRQELCSFATVLVDCEDMVIDVQEMTSFSDFAAMQPQLDDDGNLISQGFTTGGSSDRVLVRVAYRYTMMTPFIGPLLAGADSSRLFMSTIVLQTEPYNFGEEIS